MNFRSYIISPKKEAMIYIYNIECNMEWAKGGDRGSREKSEIGEQALKGGKVKRKKICGV